MGPERSPMNLLLVAAESAPRPAGTPDGAAHLKNICPMPHASLPSRSESAHALLTVVCLAGECAGNGMQACDSECSDHSNSTMARNSSRKGTGSARLLILLAINANEAVPIDTLVDALWADHPPADATSRSHTASHHCQEGVCPVRRPRSCTGSDRTPRLGVSTVDRGRRTRHVVLLHSRRPEPLGPRGRGHGDCVSDREGGVGVVARLRPERARRRVRLPGRSESPQRASSSLRSDSASTPTSRSVAMPTSSASSRH